jgi:chromosome segregation ATPase
MNFPGFSGEGSLSVNVGVSGGIDTSKLTGMMASASSATSQVIQSSTVIKEKKVEDVSGFKLQIEKLSKENTSLRGQVEKMTKIMASQTKELTTYKQAKATELKQMTTTIQTTTQVSSAEQSKMAEMQAEISRWVEENKRDDAQIASMKLTIDQQNIRIHSLETTITENTEASNKKISHLKEKLEAAIAKIKVSTGDDVADKQKLIDTELQIKKLQDHLNVQTNNATQNQITADKWKLDFENESNVSADLRRQLDEVTRSKESTNTELTDLKDEFEIFKKKLQDTEGQLSTTQDDLRKATKNHASAQEDADRQREKVKKVNKDLEAALAKSRDSEEKCRKADIKCRDWESQFQEKSRGFEVLKTKVQSLEPLCLKLQEKIVALENELKNVKDRLDFELKQDVKEQEQISDLTNKLTEKISDIEKMQMGDAEGRSKVELLTTQITTYTTQITVWRTKAEEQAKALEERESLLVQKNITIDRLRKLIAGLKNELEMAHELSLKFEINSIQTETSKMSASESIMVSAEYKKLELEAEEHKKLSIQAEQRLAQFRDENEKLVAKLADINAQLEKLTNQLNVMKTDLEVEKNEKIALKAEKEQFTLNASKSVEKEASFFKSAEEHVTTYRDEIGRAYHSISMTFAEIEHEIL